MSLHNDIMNIVAKLPQPGVSSEGCCSLSYKYGHRDARHAAAELAIEADKKIEELRTALESMLKYATRPSDSFATDNAYENYLNSVENANKTLENTK